ncbi:MAG TPA: hypothetical protein VGC66_11700 [Pyrinomonadaceae bacterium]|jgi:cell division septation protein DedD
MKRCPTCGSSYTDDTLAYCLQDGATLQSSGDQTNLLSLVATLHGDNQTNEGQDVGIDSSSAPTMQIPASSMPTTPYQESRPTAGATNNAAAASTTQTQPASNTRVIVTTALVTVLLLGLGGVGAWMLFRGGGDGRGRERRAAGANSNSALPANSTDAANTSNASQSNNQTRSDNQPDKGGRWFVILGSFPKDELGRANERLELVRKQGFDARMVSSDDYPNMKSGLWVIVMGPYTRNKAEELLEQVRPKVKDAYTKSGW